jgi:GNAT superfamily N-acetyltransferase
VDGGLTRRRDDGLVLSTDPARIDLAKVHGWLSGQSYWANGRDLATVGRSIAGSLVAGVYEGPSQLAFARVVTDRATFGWLCDVFVDEPARGRGIGTWLVAALSEHLAESGVYRLLLATRDAHDIYATVGFTPLPAPADYMIRDTR